MVMSVFDPVLLRSFVAVVDCGNFTRAAERLRIRRTTLVEKMRKYGMSRREGDEQADD